VLRRSTITLRLAIVLASLVLIAAVLRVGVARWESRTDPIRAAEIAPHDARMATLAAKAAIDAGSRLNAPAVRSPTTAALARDLTIPSAIEIRALQAAAAGDQEREARLFELSNAISRRSLPTRLWRIQRFVDRGDVAGALDEFDIALRTSSAAPDILFPVLAGATTDPALTAPIAALLDRPQEWGVMFLNYAITDAGVAPAISEVVLAMRDRRAITDNQIDQILISELVSEREFEQARRVNDAFHPRSRGRNLVQNSDFSDPASVFPFGWGLIQKGDRGAQRSIVHGRPALTYQSSPGGTGQVASQLLTLEPGGYRLVTKTAVGDSDSVSRPFWTLTCADRGGAQIVLLDQPARSGASAATEFTVPPACTGQWLALNLRQSDSRHRSGAIASVAVVRR
jgi:hypothetical protein